MLPPPLNEAGSAAFPDAVVGPVCNFGIGHFSRPGPRAPGDVPNAATITVGVTR